MLPHDLNSLGETRRLKLSDSAQQITLKGEWKCSVSDTSKQLPAYEARHVGCGKGTEIIEFTVQCEQSRPKDHTQLRFRNKDGQVTDFIEVSCEIVSK